MPEQSPIPEIWAVIPAAGIGRRMQSSIPKQYLQLNGRPVLEITLDTLLQHPAVRGVVIALQPDDPYWPTLSLQSDKPVLVATGGSERADSVLNALRHLRDACEGDSEQLWVMVHDAVRPCLRSSDIDKLIAEVGDSPDGGLLALPVRDTMKRQHENKDAMAATVAETVEREGLWHALTPQYFPLQALQQALQRALDAGRAITDESSAMEMAGFQPRLVTGHEDNIKITRPADLELAAMYLANRQQEKTL